MSPKPLKPPASFEVFAVWAWDHDEQLLDSEWSNRALAEKRALQLDEASVHAHTVWRDADAFKESQS